MTMNESIRLAKGQVVYVNLPKKMYFKNTPFSNESADVRIQIGQVLKRTIANKEKYIEVVAQEIRKTLHYDGDITKEVVDMLNSLKVNFFTDEEFDTSVFEGEYKILEHKEHGIYCEKIDDPKVKVFVKNEE